MLTTVYINGGYAFSSFKTASRIAREMTWFRVVKMGKKTLHLSSDSSVRII